jgi:hypothetical protein
LSGESLTVLDSTLQSANGHSLSVEFLVAHIFGFREFSTRACTGFAAGNSFFNDSRQAKAPRGGTESMRTLFWTAACV